VDQRSGAAEIVGLDDRALIERFSKRSEEIDDWLAEHGLSGIKASSAAAVATRAPKDRSESEQSVYERWQRQLADAGIGERELSAALTTGLFVVWNEARLPGYAGKALLLLGDPAAVSLLEQAITATSQDRRSPRPAPARLPPGAGLGSREPVTTSPCAGHCRSCQPAR